MRAIILYRITLVLTFVFFIPVFMNAQPDKKAAELKKYEAAIVSARTKVEFNERKLFVADSLISAGTELVNESKSELKTLEAERKKLDKDYAAKQKPLNKLSNSNIRPEATKAKNDLKALDIQYRADLKTLDTKVKDANKRLTTGNANITKGKTSKKAAEDALEVSQAALQAAQEKYDIATGAEESGAGKDKKKK